MRSTAAEPVLLGLSALLAAGLSGQALAGTPGKKPGSALPVRPGVILVMGDDQRWDSVVHGPGRPGVMPETAKRLGGAGLVFTDAFVSSPLCCPSRSGLLSGGFYPFHTGVLTNRLPNGSAVAFPDARSIGTLLQGVGYRTALVGKYMNGYGNLSADGGGTIRPGEYVPPGWDLFASYPEDAPDWESYRFTVGTSDAAGPTAGASLPDAAAGRRLQDLVRRGLPPEVAEALRGIDGGSLPHLLLLERLMALSFLDAAASTPERPFFLFLSSVAPHGPATPLPEHRGRFDGFTYRERGWGEEDLSDKPRHVAELDDLFVGLYDGSIPFEKGGSPDAFFGDQLRSLQALDDTVAALVKRVESDPALASRTVFIYTSDHGLMWGEHRIVGAKRQPYEESIRVPLIVRGPGIDAGFSSALVAADIDLGATLLDLAGLTAADRAGMELDGVSLRSLLEGDDDAGRKDLLIGNIAGRAADSVPSWSALRGADWKYIRHDTLEEEYYDLARDPMELDSKLPAADVLKGLRGELERRQGLMIVTRGWKEEALPPGEVGERYSLRFEARGGQQPLVWTHEENSSFGAPRRCRKIVPPGLRLHPDGRLEGTPTEAGCFQIGLQVEDSGRSPVHGGPQRHLRKARLEIEPRD